MAFSLNRITLVGNVTGDAELRYTPSGKPVVNFSLAVNDSRYKGKDDQGKGIYEDIVYFFRVISFTMAEYLGKLKKGDKVVVSGKMTYRDYTPQGQTESKRYWEVFAEDIIPFRNLKGDPSVARPEDGQPMDTSAPEDGDIAPMKKGKDLGTQVADDIPF